LLVWALGAIISASLLTSGAASMALGVAHVDTSAVQAAPSAAGVQAAGQAASNEPTCRFGLITLVPKLAVSWLSTSFPAICPPPTRLTLPRSSPLALGAVKRTPRKSEYPTFSSKRRTAKQKALNDAKTAADPTRKTGVYGVVGFHLAPGRRFLRKLYGDGRRPNPR
jgi:hypothetical protein